jgi:PAS domain S-box-containing protein
VARFDAEGRCVYANERLCAIVGRTRQEILGRGWMQQLAPELATHMPERWAELRAGHSILGVDILVRPDGRRVPVELDWLPELDADGQLGSVIVTCVDAAARRGAAEAARIREQAPSRLEELEAIYRNAPVGLSFVDRELRYLRVNQMAADMTGVGIDEMLGKTYRDFAPESADATEWIVQRLVARGEPVRNLEVRTRPPVDPEVEHTYLINTDPVRNANGEVLGFLSAVQDVTELRGAEDTAARRLRQLEILYANTPVGLCYMDAELRIVQLNPLFARLSDRPLEQQLGARAPEVLPEELACQIVPQLRYVARSGTASVDVEVRGRFQDSDSRDHTWIAQTHPVKSRDGKVAGVVAVLQDVTLMVERQREVETVRDRLAEAQRVALLGSWEWNLVDDEVWWSRELYEIFGEAPTYRPSYVGFFDHVHPDDRQKVRQQIDRTLEDDKPYRMTFRIVRPDGSERLLFTAAQLERAASGLPERLVGTCQDVTLPSLRPPLRARR